MKQTETKGPLRGLLAGFEAHLQAQGYQTSTIDQYLSFCRRFDAYLERKGLGLAESDNAVGPFIVEDMAGRTWAKGGRIARCQRLAPLKLLLRHLESEGLISSPHRATHSPPPGTTQYLDFLRKHRGFCEGSIQRQSLWIERFLAHIGAKVHEDLSTISVEQVEQYLVLLSRRLSRQSMGSPCASLRGFLRHLHMRGILKTAVHEQVVTPRLYALETLPRAVAWSEVERTLGMLDRSTILGCRDYALLMLLAYCGLRAGEVAALRLADVDWRRDLIRVYRAKTAAVDTVPLLPAVGEALIAYLRVRPIVDFDELFLTVKAPIKLMSGLMISARARHHLMYAGVQCSRLGSHTLRHSFAVDMLQRGYSLKTIGDTLGHTHARSTFIYTKGSVEDLREVALEVEEVRP